MSQTDANSTAENSQGTRTERGGGDAVGSFLSYVQSDQTGVVGVREGISYGLGLIVYILALLLVTAVVNGIGGAFLTGALSVDNGIVTAILGLFGFAVTLTAIVVLFAGFAGLQYKIISDAVSRGD
ncbi:hypothetical protein [Haloarcula pelagica]|uniref:hypothetical protein n=1 Tax=Haloarcula pelagica TaxID=3033389 RepID=UPI0024C3E29F|nr:hypothetical protein [Halomicroarcula sp. YJ-61-S]